MKRTLLFLYFAYASFCLVNGQPLIIQENDTGFCSVDGNIMTSVAGYTGAGYADTDEGIGKSVSWSIESETADTCWIKWRYGNGGGSGDRYAGLYVNLDTAVTNINFKHTGTWTNWTISDSVKIDLHEGYNDLRLVSKATDGLANIDYIQLYSSGLRRVECVAIYTAEVSQNIAEGGTITVEPELLFYPEGDTITLKAHANPGYFFQSWSGNVTSADSNYSFIVTGNIETMAMFYPDGTTMDTNIIGYATVQDDLGTPFLVIGGSLGDTVEANSLTDLQTYLQSNEPLVVTIAGKIEGTGEVKITSNKTLSGITDSAYIRGIMLQIDGAQNVIIQHLKLSHVVRWDELEITNGSRNIWIDHCEFFTDRDHNIDYYDGLLDIKNASRFITVSWCCMHDHLKCSLISSGDGSVGDTVTRITYHHNFFYNCDARLPSIRFGKAHIFNNYYLNSKDAISTRMGACVRVENNYFENIEKAVFNDQSPELGYVHLLDNHFGSAYYVTEPTCVLDVPYSYESFLDATEDIPGIVGDTTTIPPVAFQHEQKVANILTVFPNPADDHIKVRSILKYETDVITNIRDISGQIIKTMQAERFSPGKGDLMIEIADLKAGFYFVELISDKTRHSQKLFIIR